MTPAETSAYRGGRLARANGDERTANPYYGDTLQWHAWNVGYGAEPSAFNRIATWVLTLFRRA